MSSSKWKNLNNNIKKSKCFTCKIFDRVLCIDLLNSKLKIRIKYCRIHVSTKLVYNLKWVSSTNKHSIIICVSLKNSSTNYDEVTWPALHGHGSLS